VQRLAGTVTGVFGASLMGMLFWVSLGFVQNEIALFGGWGRLSAIFPVFFLLSGFRFVTLLFRPPGADRNPDPKGSPAP
jgi:hypothetical protein